MGLLLFVTAAFAQNEKYQKAMEQGISQLNSAKSGEDLQAASASFERIANAEKSQWLPFYYAALAKIWMGFAVPNEQKDDLANQADAMLTKADELSPNNAEVYIAQNMTSTIHMLVDPQTRWQTYGAKGGEALAKAKKLDENNPRIYFLEGQGVFGMPEQFGGGKAKAKPLFEKSVALFDTYKPKNDLMPTWGKKDAADMLEKCK